MRTSIRRLRVPTHRNVSALVPITFCISANLVYPRSPHPPVPRCRVDCPEFANSVITETFQFPASCDVLYRVLGEGTIRRPLSLRQAPSVAHLPIVPRLLPLSELRQMKGDRIDAAISLIAYRQYAAWLHGKVQIRLDASLLFFPSSILHILNSKPSQCSLLPLLPSSTPALAARVCRSLPLVELTCH